MEWHHAGKLPQAYGGGMKKTYFLNSNEICDIATNWVSYIERLALSKIEAKNEAELKKNLEAIRFDFLKNNATKINRVETKPLYFYQTAQEMNGKYGWFDSTNKLYNMPEYFSGWEFENVNLYNEFLNIK